MRGGQEGGKHAVVCFEHSFHGRSMGALSVTRNKKYQTPFEPLIPGVRAGVLNDYNGLEELIKEDTCGVILEPIQGEGGVNAAEVDWVRAVVRRAREVGAVVIFDEIQVRATLLICFVAGAGKSGLACPHARRARRFFVSCSLGRGTQRREIHRRGLGASPTCVIRGTSLGLAKAPKTYR